MGGSGTACPYGRAGKVGQGQQGNAKGSGKESGPKPGMTLLNLSTGEQTEYKNIKSFSFSNNGNWLFYYSFQEKQEEADRDTTAQHTTAAGGDLRSPTVCGRGTQG